MVDSIAQDESAKAFVNVPRDEFELRAPNIRTLSQLITGKDNGTVSRVRYRVVAFTMALAALTYLDRVCISIVAPDIIRDLRLTHIQMSYVFSAFTLAYALFEIPTARWADRIGSRRILTRIVLWWSVFTMMTAGAFRYAALLIIRFLFGMGKQVPGRTQPVFSHAGFPPASEEGFRASFSRVHIYPADSPRYS